MYEIVLIFFSTSDSLSTISIEEISNNRGDEHELENIDNEDGGTIDDVDQPDNFLAGTEKKNFF